MPIARQLRTERFFKIGKEVRRIIEDDVPGQAKLLVQSRCQFFFDLLKEFIFESDKKSLLYMRMLFPALSQFSLTDKFIRSIPETITIKLMGVKS